MGPPYGPHYIPSRCESLVSPGLAAPVMFSFILFLPKSSLGHMFIDNHMHDVDTHISSCYSALKQEGIPFGDMGSQVLKSSLLRIFNFIQSITA